MVLGSFPFILILSIAEGTSRRYTPSTDDSTYGLGQSLHILSIILCVGGIILAISMKILAIKKSVELANFI